MEKMPMFWNSLSRKEQILMAKRFFEYDRYNDYLKRFSDEDALISKSKSLLKKHSFFPSSAFTEVISERAELTPSDFLITGKEKDFLKTYLLEDSDLMAKLPSLYREQDLAGDAFWKLSVVESKKKELMYHIKPEKLNSEEVTPIVDPYTKEPIKYIVEYTISVPNEEGGESIQRIKETYSMEKIEIQYITRSDNMFKKENVTFSTVENPFKEYEILPILWFKSYPKSGTVYSEIPAMGLFEPILQLDFYQTDIENTTHRCAYPIVELRKAMKKYGDIMFGAGTIFYSRGEEELHIHAPELELEPLEIREKKKVDAVYKAGGLVPPTLRKDMFSSSSSKLAKYASKEFIDLTKTRLQNITTELKKMIKLFLELNGKIYTDEKIAPPDDILSIDKEELLKNIAVEISLGLIDDVYIWDKYYPELSEEDRSRIRQFVKERNVDVNDENLNIDNRIKSGSITGNKKLNSLNPDEKESVVSKSK
jgi:hypothetical protein